MGKSNGKTNALDAGSLDYSDKEVTIKNITLPQTIFRAKWEKDKGYSVGIATAKLTEDYETLNEALAVVGLKVEVDKGGDEILMQEGEVDYDLIGRICAVLIEQFHGMRVEA